MRAVWMALKNFRAFHDETRIWLSPFSVIVGKNDSGKSSVLHGLDIFFNNRNPDLDDFSRDSAEDEPMELTVAFDELPSSVQLVEEGVDTALSEERLLDSHGNLVVKRTFSRKKLRQRSTSLLVSDFIEGEFSNLCSLKESDLNKLGDSNGLDFSKAGRSITNKSKRDALRAKAVELGVGEGDTEVDASDDLARAIDHLLPRFRLFAADSRLSEEETPFQSVFKDMVRDILPEQTSASEVETFVAEFIDAEAQKILRYLLDHTQDVTEIKARPEFKWRDLVSFHFDTTDADGVVVPLVKRGAGLRRLLMVAYFQYLAAEKQADIPFENRIFAIEEPETYLHPGAQRSLIASLERIAQDNQFICSSHSPVFAGRSEPEALALIIREGREARCVQGQDLDPYDVAAELGVEPSDQIYAYTACVFVEGEDDILFFETIADILAKAGRIPCTLCERGIGFVPVGGAENLKHWINRRALKGLNKNCAVIVDSDRRSPTHAIPRRKLNWKASCEEGGVKFHVLRKREIENYLHPTAVTAFTSSKADFDDFTDMKRTFGPNVVKAVQHMSADDLLERDTYVEDHVEHHEILEILEDLLALPT